MKKKTPQEILTLETVERRIFLIRGHRVMLDSDLAGLYGVPTKVLLQAVKRNRKRFPNDFMCQLTGQKVANLRSQFVTSSWGGRRYLPYAFTEQGVAMLSSVLNSERAIQVNIAIMRAFVRLREILSTHKVLARKLAELEGKVSKHDEEIQAIFNVIRRLMAPPTRAIGFHTKRSTDRTPPRIDSIRKTSTVSPSAIHEKLP